MAKPECRSEVSTMASARSGSTTSPPPGCEPFDALTSASRRRGWAAVYGQLVEPLLRSRYRLIEVVGRGAMGQVWRADDTTLGRQVAIKELNPAAVVDPAE